MKLDGTLGKGFRLGDWLVKPIEGLILGANESRHLQPKTMDVLVTLAEANGQVMTRDDLVTRVWGANAISDEPLTRCIHELRRALDDDRGEPTFIQTIPKRGYRLLTETEELGAIEELILEGNEPGENPLRQVSRQRVLWVGLVYALLAWCFVQLGQIAESKASVQAAPPEWLLPALALVLLLGFPVAVFMAWVQQQKFDGLNEALNARNTLEGMRSLLWSRRGIDMVLVTLVISLLAGVALDIVPFTKANAVVRDRPAIAVLPFTSNHNAEDSNWLGQGISEDLQTRLAESAGLTVSSISISFRPSLQSMRPQQIGQELGVQYLLRGFIIRGHDSMRIKTSLVDAVTGLEVWTQTWSRGSGSLFAVQAEISSAVLDYFGLDAEASQAGIPHISLVAYDSFLRGRSILRNARSASAARDASRWFERALATDDRMPMARNALCQSYVLAMKLGGGDGIYGHANSACAEAILYSPDLPAAHLALADFYRVSEHPQEALTEYQWVLDRQAGNTSAWFGLAQAFIAQGSSADAEDAFLRVLELKPDLVDAREAYVAFLLAAGRYREALEEARVLVRLDRDRVSGYDYLSTALLMDGDFEAAIKASREVLSRDIENRPAVLRIALSYYYMGYYDNAVTIYSQAARLQPNDYHAYGGLGNAYAQLDVAEAATLAKDSYLRARGLAEQQVLADPEDTDGRVDLAFYCAALNDQSCARRYLTEALELAPDDVRIHYMAARIHARAGDLRAASIATQRALALGYPEALISTDPLLADAWSERRFAYNRFSAIFHR